MKKLIEMEQKEIRAVVKKLEEALSSDAGERAAIAYAGIDEEDYRLLAERHPKIKEIAKNASGVLGAKASMNIKEAINEGDVPTSKWYKELTDERYSKKVNVSAVVVSEEEREQAMKEMLEGLNDGK